MQKLRQSVLLAFGGLLMVESAVLSAPTSMAEGAYFFGSNDKNQSLNRIAFDTAQTYSPQIGFGFQTAPSPGLLPGGSGLLVSEKPFKFAVDLANGNYEITLTFGGADFASDTTVKTEMRRLMLENVRVAPREKVTRSFTVNVRDGQLNLEFLGAKPAIAALDVIPSDAAITLYLAGDSTVCDQQDEPWAGWGQLLPRFFEPGVAIANHAHSGRALKSFIWEKRLDAILATIKPGDYLFVQFTHNDQKPGAAYAEPFTTFKEQLQIYIDAARQRGAIPVLVTSMHRRRFDENGKVVNTLLEYPDAMREKAREENVALIDLNAMSRELYEAWGPETSKKAFVHYPANTFPGQEKALRDDTHFNTYGAYELAKCVVLGIKNSDLDLKRFLTDDAIDMNFVPSHPDAPVTVQIPASPFTPVVKPEGS